MGGLKILRHLVGLAWIGAFIWGIVSLFSGNWILLVIAVVAWIALGAVFRGLHGALEQAEVDAVDALMTRIALAVEDEQWTDALLHSQRAVDLLHSSANRDRIALGSGNGENMIGPLGLALVGHGIILGANGRLDEARLALGQGLPVMSRFLGEVPETSQHLLLARQLQGPFTTLADFRQAARTFHSFA